MKLIDRLMARQTRLMANLDEPRIKPKVLETVRRVTHDPAVEIEAHEKAASLLVAGDLARARAVLEPFMANGSQIATCTTLARICTEQGDFTAALAALRQAESLNPADHSVWRLTAKLLATHKQFSEALVYLRRLSMADPSAPASAHVDLLRGILRAREKLPRPASVMRANRRELESALRRFTAAPDADDALRQQFASLYYLLSNGSSEAVGIYNTVDPCPPTHRDVTAKIVSLESWCMLHKLPFLSCRIDGSDSDRHVLYSIKNPQIHAALDWIPILDDGRALAPARTLESKHFRAMTPDSPLLLFRGSHAELRIPRQLPIVRETALLIGGSVSYHDTLVRDLCGLAVAESVGLSKDIPLVVRADMAPFQREMLRLLGYDKNRLIEVRTGQPMQFAALWIPSRLAKGARSTAPLIGRWYRSRFVQTSRPPARKLYVPSGLDVEIVNADAVASLLSSLGFETVETRNLDVQEQIDLFAEASLVVGATNEGLTNILFCLPGTAILELRPLHWAASGGHLDFESLASACGHRYTTQDCLRAGGRPGRPVKVSVDLDQLAHQLDELL